MEIMMDGDFYGGGGNSSNYGGENSSDINVPRMTLEQYNSLDEKPELWFRTDEPPEGRKKLTAEQVSYDNSSTSRHYTINHSLSHDITVTDSFENIHEELDKIKENMNRKLNITMLHGCRNCGAKIDVDINKPVFHCKYCGTSYVIGSVQQNSTY